MKRIILSTIVMSLAVVLHAGDAKTSQAKDQPSCCSSKMKTSLQTADTEKSACCSSKTKTSLEAKDASCPFAKAACCKKKEVKQTALLSPKAAELLR
jgi:hypothetical protein